jgi:hypothetical protein
MGACFVMRELVRSGQLGGEFVKPHCYVAPQRVRDLLVEIGCSELNGTEGTAAWQLSPIIHKFLKQYMQADRVDFNGCFDLPFLVLAERDDLKAAVLYD